MEIRLQSIEHGPSSLPIWQTILDDLGRPPVGRIARVLGLSARTVYRYNQTGEAPRVVLLALFWLTSWGRSSVYTQAWNDAQLALSYVSSLRSQVARLEAELAHVAALGQSGAANDPLLRGPHA